MLPREKLQVVLGFFGVFLVGFGIAVFQPGARQEHLMPSRGVGFWKDHSFEVATGRKIGSWMIGGGVVAIALAYAVRERQ